MFPLVRDYVTRHAGEPAAVVQTTNRGRPVTLHLGSRTAVVTPPQLVPANPRGSLGAVTTVGAIGRFLVRLVLGDVFSALVPIASALKLVPQALTQGVSGSRAARHRRWVRRA